MRPRGADRVMAGLKAAGVTRIFSLSGNHIMEVFDALLGSGIEIVHTRHEAAAVHMADAYARASGKAGTFDKHRRIRSHILGTTSLHCKR